MDLTEFFACFWTLICLESTLSLLPAPGHDWFKSMVTCHAHCWVTNPEISVNSRTKLLTLLAQALVVVTKAKA